MSPHSQWNGWDGRWHQTQHQDRYADERRYPPTPAVSAVSQGTTAVSQTFTPSWGDKSGVEEQHHRSHRLPSLTDPYTDASNYPGGSDQRHKSPLTATSRSDERFTSPWHSLPYDHRAQQPQSNLGPLSLKIPEAQQDLPRIATDNKFSIGTPISRQQTTTSLPSFASFHEHATRNDEPDEVEIAPMSARLPCSMCTKLKPKIYEVAIAVAAFDETAQTHFSKPTARPFDVPADDPARALQWILDRLTKAKCDFQETSRMRDASSHYAPQYAGFTNPRTAGTEVSSPPNPLKRSAWDYDDQPMSKRRGSIMPSNDGPHPTSNPAPKDERGASTDFATGSTPPMEYLTGLAHARTGSPGMSTRPPRNPPSPSSLAYPPSAAPSVVPPQTQSMGSPATSYQPTVSLHSASTSSATSAHIADLQHQVTLKSLSLSTLQSEYSSLLQKLQRERLKSQAIEKKTSVADQEVNDLTSRVEELTDQVKSLEASLDACEKKRESERTEAAREKDQWGRMLELGGRLQTKHAEEKQKLRDENHALAQRVAGYESNRQGSLPPLPASTITPPARRNQEGETNALQQAPQRPGPAEFAAPPGEVSNLRRENEILHSRIENLRFCLEEARRHTQLLDERAHEVMSRSGQIGSVVRRALEDEDDRITPGKRTKVIEGVESGIPPDFRTTQEVYSGSAGAPRQSLDTSMPSSGAESRKVSQHSIGSSTATSTLASLARAVSPGPAELGFHVTPSTSSPEELIRALGPVPAPLPANQFGAHFHPPPPVPSKKQSRARQTKQPRRQSTDAVNSWLMPRIAEQPESHDAFHIGSFRPLSQNTHFQQHSNFRPAEHDDTAPHSHHSSPGPVRDGHSPSSISSGEGKVQLPSLSAMDQRRNSSYEGTRSAEHSAVMPPPPRPAALSAGPPVMASQHQRGAMS
ncbi:uncharacterized protein LTR77_011023 [Saxophila tyrrhenica]|uniref:Uncharacterized protein n=1 Tax=Saxophila tyrrhenica TaxID=1690608 RepID=A0AAV9NTN5_9PEZI|nr:hypothetical protein LTR77_011023 [Saxophila tyrrhenica]